MSMSEEVFLRPDAKIECLTGRWYIWHHLIPPVQRALNIAYRYLPLLESFVENPSVHIAATRDPKLLGGRFMELSEHDIPAVGSLLSQAKETYSDMVQLANDVKNLDQRLREAATGFSLDDLYRDLPDTLAGVVEFAYDVNCRPSLRLRERLLYSDPRYADSSGHEILLYTGRDDARKFFLNTPRLGTNGQQLSIPASFAGPGVDTLSSMRLSPRPIRALAEELPGIDGDAAARFFTSDIPERKSADYEGDGVRVRYFGHACVLVQTSSVSVLVDPRFAFERDDALATLTFSDLPDHIDYVIISHAHQDHFCIETLIQLRHRTGCIVVPRNSPGKIADPSMKFALNHLGFTNVMAVDELDGIPLPDGQILSVPFSGEHCGLDIASKQCIVISVKRRRFVFLVDSDVVDVALYRRIHDLVSDADALFIGMECHGAPLTWLYGPLLTQTVTRRDNDSRRGNGSNFERAWQLVQTIGCSRLFIYAMGMEPWNRHLLGLEYGPESIQIAESTRLLDACAEEGIPAERLRGCREFEF
jgi:L-ascorbate metabolism protein UlaG (beta-lactamase superfamily)